MADTDTETITFEAAVSQLDTRMGNVEQKIDQLLLRLEQMDRRRR